MEDTEIIGLYFARDEKAITETDRKYHGYLYTIANNILSDREDSNECLNDTYLKTWNSIPPERPNHFPAWLSRIIRNLALDLYRKKTRIKRTGDQYALCVEELDNMLKSNDDPEESVRLSVLKDAINTFLWNLPAKQRQLFICRYYFMDPLNDAARYCGFSPAAAKSSLFRMRNDLREYLIREGFDL